MSGPVTLKNGDKIVLGDRFEIDIFFEDKNAAASDETGDETLKEETLKDEIPQPQVSAVEPVSAANPGGGNSVPISFFYIAPVLGIVILLLVGGIFLVIKSGEKKEITEGNDFIYTSNRLRENNQTEDFNNENSDNNSSNISIPANESVNIDSGNISTNEIIESNSEPPVNQPITERKSGRTREDRNNSASFLRRIAQRDPRAALTGKHQKFFSGKINQFKNSSALAANLKSARANAAQIQITGKSKKSQTAISDRRRACQTRKFDGRCFGGGAGDGECSGRTFAQCRRRIFRRQPFGNRGLRTRRGGKNSGNAKYAARIDR